MQLIALDDFDGPIAALRCFQCGAWPLVACIGEDAQDERKQCARTRVENERRPIAVLDIGRMNNGVQQKAECIFENVALLASDLFPRIEATRIDARPLFPPS